MQTDEQIEFGKRIREKTLEAILDIIININ